MDFELIKITSDDIIQYKTDMQEAFQKGFEDVYGKCDEIILPEFRAQRRINEVRIPEIKRYILENRNTYVFSALSASIDGKFVFVSHDGTDVGILEIDMESIFLINDGQ